MRDKKQLVEDAKKNLNLSAEEVQIYENSKKIADMWGEIVHDFSLTSTQASIATALWNSRLNPTNQSELDLFVKYNPNTKRAEPIGLKPTSVSKEGFIDLINQIEANIKKDEPVYNYAGLGGRRVNVNSFYVTDSGHINRETVRLSDSPNNLPDPPAVVRKPNWFKRLAHTIFGAFKADIDAYNKYKIDLVSHEAEVQQANDQVAAEQAFLQGKDEMFEERKREIAIETKVEEKAISLRTEEEKMVQEAEASKKVNEVIDLGAGRINKVLERHESYKGLAETPVYKSSKLPMEGLALLSGVSEKANEGVTDASSDVQTEYKLAEGQTVTPEDEELVRNIAIHANRTNITAKVIQTFYMGSDRERMGWRGRGVLNGRKMLNEAAKEYDAGNKQPLADFLKDCTSMMIEYVVSDKTTIFANYGQVIAESGHAVQQLFKQDPELKKMVGISDKDLNVLYGAANLISEVGHPEISKAESFEKHMKPGAENKEAYLREILYKKYLSEKVIGAMQKNAKEAAAYADQQASTKGMELVAKYGNDMSIYSGYHMLCRDSKCVAFEGFNQYIDKPYNDQKIKEQFEKDIVNTPQFKELLAMDREELAKVNIKEVFKEIVAQNEINKQLQKEQAPLDKEYAEKAKDNQAKQQAEVDKRQARYGKIQNLNVTKVINPREEYVKQQKKLADLLLHPEEHGFQKKNMSSMERRQAEAIYMDEFKTCLATMIATKQVEDYIAKKGDGLSQDQKDALCSKENIANKTRRLKGSQAMGILTNPNNSFVQPHNLSKLAIGAEQIMDPDAVPSTEPSKLSDAAIKDLTDKFTAITKEKYPVDEVLSQVKEPEKQAGGPAV